MPRSEAPIDPSAPIACSLDATALRARREDVAALARDALLGRAPIPGGERLTFAGDAGDGLERLVAAEAACCPFLRLDLRRDGDELVLDVTGPPGARPIIEELFA